MATNAPNGMPAAVSIFQIPSIGKLFRLNQNSGEFCYNSKFARSATPSRLSLNNIIMKSGRRRTKPAQAPLPRWLVRGDNVYKKVLLLPRARPVFQGEEPERP